ncbi:phage holin family protein [Rufibacter ruber]|uniref:phage holin family protein n=1 Tax=Rufibacter ruber TaxID=1783499 RepID=UPI000832E8FC|nr:phage holin family protein [Rufibacter ruber]
MNKSNQNRKFVFGFMTPVDFITSTLGLKTKTFNFIGSITTTVITTILKLLGLVYSSQAAIYLLLFVMALDWISGAYKAFKLKKFNSFTFQRMLVNVFFTLMLVGVGYQMSLVFKDLVVIGDVLKYLPEFLIGGFMFTYFFSILENLHQADSKLVSPKMYKWLKTILDLDSLVPKFLKSKGVAVPSSEPEEKKEESTDDAGE